MRKHIILGLLLAAGLLCRPVHSQSTVADLILLNGRVWTGEGDAPTARSIAIRGNRIVGLDAGVKKLSGKNTQVIDLGGRLVTPGFNDAHIHFLGGSLGLSEIDLTGATTVAEMTKRVAEYARTHPGTDWINGRGWEYYPFPGGLPTRQMLDAVVRDRPVFLGAYDGHSGWANSRALEMAGVGRETKYEGFGEIVRDAGGEPTGALKEGAQGLVRRLIPAPTRERRLQALRDGMKMAAALGITSLQNASGSPEELALYAELAQKGELTLRAGIAFSMGQRLTDAQIEQFAALKKQYETHPLLRAGAVKFAVDGVIESHTAAMLEPYSDDPKTSGTLSWPVDAYQAMVARMDKLGFQIYTHAIGDRGVRTALDAYENAQRVNGRRDSRHRVEHLETIAASDMPRFAKLGVLASMEPIHAYPGTIDVWSKAIGPERTQRGFPWAELRRHGARLVFSSDWAAAISVDPLRGIHNAVNRRTLDGQPPGGWIPQHRLTLPVAMRAYTVEGAYASFTEQDKGTLALGKLADLIVFSDDLFRMNPMKLHESRVVLTMVDGKIVHRD
ncbi:MAG: amidohydrolase, partial [Blastocatellia bacterium]